MQSVTERWYVIYAQIVVGIATLLLAAGLASWFVPQASMLRHWGFTYITCSLSASAILYYFGWHKRQVKLSGAYNATIMLLLILALNVMTIIHGSGRLHSWFLLLWYVIILGAGMFGSYGLAGCSFFMTSYFVLISTDSFGNTSHDPASIGAIFVTWLLCIVSYYLWKPHYVDDISQRVSKLSKLLKSKQLQSESLIQAISDGVVVIDIEGTILLMNPAAAEMVGWKITDTIGISVKTVITLSDDKGQILPDNDNPFKTIIATKRATSQTVNLVSRDGSSRVVSIVTSMVLEQGSQEIAAIVAVFRDITATYAQEKRSADFISTASHEMRTPVAAIEGYLALALNEHVSKIDAKARDYLEKAHASAEHLGQLFQDLLNSAKAEDGRLVSHPVVMEMGTYLEQLTDSLKFSAQKKALLTDFTIGASTAEGKTINGGKMVRPLYYVFADPDRIREVITNLFDNAVKYTEEGKVSLGLTGNDKVVQLFIHDTGHGIPQQDIPHLFQKFYRVDNSATRTIGGTGLGLFICRKIIELYNGRIWVDSEFGKGSTFYINLPRISTDKAMEIQRQLANQGLAIPNNGTTPVI